MKNKYFLLLEWEVSYLELEFNDVKNIKYQREIHFTSIYHSLDSKQCIRYFHGVCLF